MRVCVAEDNDEERRSETGSLYGLPIGHVPAYRAVFLISNAALIQLVIQSVLLKQRSIFGINKLPWSHLV